MNSVRGGGSLGCLHHVSHHSTAHTGATIASPISTARIGRAATGRSPGSWQAISGCRGGEVGMAVAPFPR